MNAKDEAVGSIPSSPSGSSGASESENTDVDIVSLIFGSNSGATGGSQDSATEKPPLDQPKSKRRKKLGAIDDNNANNVPPFSESTEDSFSVQLPSVFQYAAKKNETLFRRDQQIKQDLIEQDERVRREYQELQSQQATVLKELNDNGSRGAIQFSLGADKEYVEQLIRLRRSGKDGVRHFYLFTGNVEIPSANFDPDSLDDFLLSVSTKQDIASPQDEKTLSQYVGLALESAEVRLIQAVLSFLIRVQEARRKSLGDTEGTSQDTTGRTFQDWFRWLGGNVTFEEENSSLVLPTRLVYYYQDARIKIYKIAILYYWKVLLPQIDPDSVSYYLRVLILISSDYFLAKQHSKLTFEVLTPLFFNLLDKYSGAEREEKIVQDFNKQLTYCSLSDEQIYNLLRQLQVYGNEMLLEADDEVHRLRAVSYVGIVTSLALTYIGGARGSNQIHTNHASAPDFDFSPPLEYSMGVFETLRKSVHDQASFNFSKHLHSIKLFDATFNIFKNVKEAKVLQEVLITLQDLKDSLHKLLGDLSSKRSKLVEGAKLEEREGEMEQTDEIEIDDNDTKKRDMSQLTQLYEIIEAITLRVDKQMIWNQNHSDLFYSA